MAGIFLNNKVIIKLSNTESVHSSIYKYTDLTRNKESGTSSTASYFISTSSNTSNLILDFLDCSYYPFVVDVEKVKEYIVIIDRCLNKISKYDFHGELKDYYRYKNYYMTTDDTEFSIGKAVGEVDDNNRSYLRFENENEEVMKFRGIVIAILANLVIEKRNNINYIYPIVKEEVMDEYLKEDDTVEYTEDTTNKEMFKKWLIDQNLAEKTVANYVNSISITSREAIIDGVLDKSLYYYSDVNEVKDIYSKLKNNEKFNFRTNAYNNINTAAMNHYIMYLERDKNEVINVLEEPDKYDKENFLKEVFISEEKYDSITSMLDKKKNIILEGAPGVGKTFMAKRLAYSLIGRQDDSRIEFIQFHQSYSYEDFIEGYRPTKDGFELNKGLFYDVCDRASKDLDNNYYIIIDEINRGNLSRIFGELLMLIENDKRGKNNQLKLAYSKEYFSVPENLYIIGLMNTADRSLALIDYALRRRFAFFTIEPAFENEKFIAEFSEKFEEDFNYIISIIKKINEAIEDDKSLGSGFKIGHSYFCPKLVDRKGNKKDIKDIIRFEILPLLEEYWYDDKDTLIQWTEELNGALK